MRLYRLLLRMYPSGFRREFGAGMTDVFEEKLRHANGAGPRLKVWLEVFSDVLRHAIPLHLDAYRMDLRYAVRALKRTPGFAVTVVLVSALGIGANTAVFTVVDHVLLRDLPFAEPDRLVRVWEAPPGYGQMEVSPPNYRDWLTMATSFDGMRAYNRTSANFAGRGDPDRLNGAAVSVGLFEVLGRSPLIGTTFETGDDVFGAGNKVLLSYGLWQQRFGAEQDIVGQTVILDDVPHVITGVMPPDVFFPDTRSRYWVPLQLGPGDAEDRTNNTLEVVARLKRGVTLDAAEAEMRQVMAQLELQYPVANEDNGANVNLLAAEVPWQSRLMLFALIGGSLCVLLITCTNLANLLLARAMARRGEMAVRSSLGAGSDRLVRQLLTESLVFALLGGLGGIFLAHLALPFLMRLVPPSIPTAGTLALDARVLGFALLVTVLTGLGFGAFPAWRVGRRAAAGLGSAGRGGHGRREGMRSVLVVVEVGACVVLLIASGLLIRALSEVRSTNPGFNAAGVITARTWLPVPRYAPMEARHEFYTRVVQELEQVPGVESAAFTSFLPMVMGGGIWPVVTEDGETGRRSGNRTASLRFVTPNYFSTMGIRMRAGRDIDERDTREDPFVAVVSQSFADRFLPGQDPLGQTFQFAFFDRTIVGVVDDVMVRGLERQSEPQVYLSHQQVPDGGVSFYAPKDLAVRVSGDPRSFVPFIQAAVQRADPLQPVTDVQTLEELVLANTASRDVQIRVLSAFAVLAFLLAAVGIHGLLAFSTSMRAREIGVRVALGAQPGSIVKMFVREGIVLGGAGVVVGAGGGYLAGKWLEALLFGVAPFDPVTFGAAVGLALAMTLAGTLPPALRASSVDPNRILRDA